MSLAYSATFGYLLTVLLFCNLQVILFCFCCCHFCFVFVQLFAHKVSHFKAAKYLGILSHSLPPPPPPLFFDLSNILPYFCQYVFFFFFSFFVFLFNLPSSLSVNTSVRMEWSVLYPGVISCLLQCYIHFQIPGRNPDLLLKRFLVFIYSV